MESNRKLTRHFPQPVRKSCVRLRKILNGILLVNRHQLLLTAASQLTVHLPKTYLAKSDAGNLMSQESMYSAEKLEVAIKKVISDALQTEANDVPLCSNNDSGCKVYAASLISLILKHWALRFVH